MKTISLNGAWNFSWNGGGALPAAVPGCNYHDLLRLGKIEDPFTGENEPKSSWVGETGFVYSRQFTLEAEDLAADRIALSCTMLDTLCRVYVNDILVGEGQNCHIGCEFDVTGPVSAGINAIRVEFDAPVKYARAMAEAYKTPPDVNFRGRTHIRKPQCHFGWDWGPCIPVSGIVGDIALHCITGAKLLPMEIAQKHADGKVTVCAKAKAETFQDGIALRLTLLSPEGEILAQSDGDTLECEIENPQLWWTHDLGGQPLYILRTEAVCNGDCADVMERKIGLRTIALNREKDEFGHNFQFVLNGVPIFAKGANYIPPDAFPDRATVEVKRGLLEACLKANMNMVRVWGGGYYETDAFYDLCDRMGLLVWQDFAFACAPYPFDREDFLQNVRDEVAYNVTRLRHHASLALWCGNNELEAMALLWKNYVGLSRWVEKFFWGLLPGWVREYDAVTPFISTSPTGEAYLKGVASDREGDTHLWHVWHGLQPLNFYRKRMTRFCSEFGLESLPSMEAVRSFAEPEDYDVESPVFNAHQKCRSGNQKILYYLLSQYRLPKGFRDMLYLSQLTQAECVRDATEHWRRNRGRCNGSLYWQLNDCWPVCSWASIDYLGRDKALQYWARRFNEPVAVSFEESKKNVGIHVINDTREARSLTLSCQLMDFDGQMISGYEGPVEAKPLSVVKVTGAFLFTKNFNRVLRAQLKDGDQVISQRTLLFGKEKDLGLPRCAFQAKAEVKNDIAYITIQSDQFARSVFLESDLTAGNFSDNFFDLFPGEPVTVTVDANGRTEEEIRQSLRVLTVGNIANTYDRAYCSAKQLKMLARPVNLGAWVVFRLGLA